MGAQPQDGEVPTAAQTSRNIGSVGRSAGERTFQRLRRARARSLPAPLRRTSSPGMRLAIVSPFPSEISGVGQYGARLAEGMLRAHRFSEVCLYANQSA